MELTTTADGELGLRSGLGIGLGLGFGLRSGLVLGLGLGLDVITVPVNPSVGMGVHVGPTEF